MKLHIFLISFVFSTLFLINCSDENSKEAEGTNQQKNSSPIQKEFKAYNFEIVSQQKNVVDKLNMLSSSVELGDTNIVDNNFILVGETIDEALSVIDSIGPFEGDDSFRNATKELILFYKALIEGEYRQIVLINRKSPDLQTEQDHRTLDSLMGIMQQGTSILQKKFMDAQKQMAEKYQVILIKE